MAAVIVKNMSFKVGQMLTIVGKALPDASSFDLNLGPNETDIALHVNPRFNAHFDKNVVLCNSYQDGKWGEEQREGGFPFRQGEEFKIIVWFTPAGFQVPLSDGSLIQFPNRLGAEEYSFIGFRGDARLTSLEIK